MRYVEVATSTAYSWRQIRERHPTTSIAREGGDLTELGYAPLIETPRPEPVPFHRVVPGAIALSNGQWATTWVQQPLGEQEIAGAYERAVDAHLDAAAQARGYASIVTAVTYAGDAHPKFGPEGDAFKAWRSAVYAACYTILAAVQAGERPPPTLEQLMAELPPLDLPAP